MTHIIEFRVKIPGRGTSTYEHRPAGRVGFRYIRRDRKPITDEDLAEVHRCDICYPAGRGKMIDRMTR